MLNITSRHHYEHTHKVKKHHARARLISGENICLRNSNFTQENSKHETFRFMMGIFWNVLRNMRFSLFVLCLETELNVYENLKDPCNVKELSHRFRKTIFITTRTNIFCAALCQIIIRCLRENLSLGILFLMAKKYGITKT